ncbi:hypothetical protein E3N88_21962 [Mikania micrantha]|uniref:RIN4 pathogenic type III effector avirulence factor Avr cleavage site domain-containing protein n=1 Tax=Mikania micrantha TaxID=192012 RepID=A0A5N6N939_9ASTR|nr:hypothetical protein E3N88_21962 [Mikania micrantha]
MARRESTSVVQKNQIVPEFDYWENDDDASYMTFFNKAPKEPSLVGQTRPKIPKFGYWEHEKNASYTTYFDKTHTKVPKFGYWEDEENASYTTYFDKVPHRKPNLSLQPAACKHAMVSRFDDWEIEDNVSYMTYVNEVKDELPSIGQPCKVVLADSHGIPRARCYSGLSVNDTQDGPPSVGRVRPGMRSTDPSPHKIHYVNNTTVIPEFGEWEASSNEPYTDIFNKIREERVIGTPMVARPYYNMSHNHKPNNKS